jgi:superfamily II DNA or RNA helicase
MKKLVKQTKEKLQKVPYHYKPDDLDLVQWQLALRKQFVKDKSFGIQKLNKKPVFGDYRVTNPENQNTYKVAIRSNDNTLNFCSCLDFKTNQLGTCKHIEAVKFKIESDPKLSDIIKKDYIPPYTSVYLHYKGKRCVKIRIGSDYKSEFIKLANNYFDEKFILKPEAFLYFERFLSIAKSISNEFRCYDDAMDFVLENRENNRRNLLISDSYNENNSLDHLIDTTLFSYQKEGILFAAKAGRSLIADDMGLGKTIQAIATAELLKKEFKISNVLIVCPTSLKYQWQSEIQKFTKSTVKVIEGSPHIRESQYLSDEFYKVVSYHTLKNDIKTINKAEVDLVILDEAQRIKNWKTKLAQGVKKINSRYTVVLTGTPLENKLEDLYSIIQFIDPFKLGPYYKFLDYYQVKNESGKVIGYEHLNEIGQLLSDIMIRRTKKEVLSQLPQRLDKNLLVPMTETQMEWHEGYKDIVAKLVYKWRKFRFLSEKDRQRLLINLNLMRMVCDSTYIVDQQSRNDTKIDELICILDEYFDGNAEKAVIFSQWERMTRLISQELDKLGIKYEYLHGGVPSSKRKQLFDNFNSDEDCRIFLSTDAGSTGLNLQSASLIVNMDIPWNPAVLEQRIARIYRMGQKSNVSVINFVSRGTIEHRMLDVLKFKTSLSQGILDNGEDSIFLSDSKFNQFMKTIEEIAEPVEKTNTQPNFVSDEELSEKEELNVKEKAVAETPISQTDIFDTNTADENENVIETESVSLSVNQNKDSEPELDATALITQGISFISGFAKALSSPESTEKLVSSLVEKDKVTGKTYMKIPVENEKAITNALNLLGQLFKGLAK